MTREQIAEAARQVIELIAGKKCTVAEANEILDCAKGGIASSSMVQK